MRRYTAKEAAAILGYSESTLRHWRCGCKRWEPGLGPRFFAVNGRIFYTGESLLDWMRAFASDTGIDGLQASDLLA